MTKYGDTVSIAATSAGVAGNITVPMGAVLTGINLSGTNAAAAVVLKRVALAIVGLPLIAYVPSMLAIGSTNGVAIAMCKTPMIRLPRISVGSAQTVAITLTSTANMTFQVGLMWEAA